MNEDLRKEMMMVVEDYAKEFKEQFETLIDEDGLEEVKNYFADNFMAGYRWGKSERDSLNKQEKKIERMINKIHKVAFEPNSEVEE